MSIVFLPTLFIILTIIIVGAILGRIVTKSEKVPHLALPVKGETWALKSYFKGPWPPTNYSKITIIDVAEGWVRNCIGNG